MVSRYVRIRENIKVGRSRSYLAAFVFWSSSRVYWWVASRFFQSLLGFTHFEKKSNKVEDYWKLGSEWWLQCEACVVVHWFVYGMAPFISNYAIGQDSGSMYQIELKRYKLQWRAEWLLFNNIQRNWLQRSLFHGLPEQHVYPENIWCMIRQIRPWISQLHGSYCNMPVFSFQ